MRHLRYLSYVVRHKAFVFYAGLSTRAPLWRLVIHDWSKFLPSEWRPYVQKFHGGKESQESIFRYHGDPRMERMRRPYKERVDAEFNVAWLKHQHRNPHHWQHWLLAEDNPAKRLDVPQTSGQPRAFPLPMPEKFVREMVADWMGAGRAITGRWEVREWYEKNKTNIVLDPDTRIRVERIMAEVA